MKLTKNPVALGVAGLAGGAVLLLLFRGQSSSSGYAVLLPSPVQGGGSGSFEPGPTTPATPTKPAEPVTPTKPTRPDPDAFRDPVPMPSPIPPKAQELLEQFRRILPGPITPTKPISPIAPPTKPVVGPASIKEAITLPITLPVSLKPILDAADDLTEGLAAIAKPEPGVGQQITPLSGFDDDVIQEIRTGVTAPIKSITSVTLPPIKNVALPIKNAVASVKGSVQGAAVNLK